MPTPPSASGSRTPSSTPPAQNSLRASLSRLGITLSPGQMIGTVAGVVAGLMTACLLPYIYPIFAAPVLDLVFGPGPSPLRDGFNTNLMTTCTCCGSFAIALMGSLALHGRKKPKP